MRRCFVTGCEQRRNGVLFGGRQQPRHPLAHLVFGQRARESVDDLSVAQRVHGRNRLHLERTGNGRIRIDVDLGEHDFAAGRGNDLFDDRAERLAGPAPRRPQVDDNDDTLRALDDVGLEGLVGGVENDVRRVSVCHVRVRHVHALTIPLTSSASTG